MAQAFGLSIRSNPSLKYGAADLCYIFDAFEYLAGSLYGDSQKHVQVFFLHTLDPSLFPTAQKELLKLFALLPKKIEQMEKLYEPRKIQITEDSISNSARL